MIFFASLQIALPQKGRKLEKEGHSFDLTLQTNDASQDCKISFPRLEVEAHFSIEWNCIFKVL